MKIAGSYKFDATHDAVWDALQDPTTLTKVLPGCEALEETGENRYSGQLNMKVGPVQGVFQGNLEMRDIEPRDSFALAIDGRGAPGFVKATARVTLRSEADGTVVEYDSDAQVGGRIAGVGQRLLDSSAKSIIQQSMDGFQALLSAGADESEGEAADYEAPTQAEFAAKVAKAVAKDVIPRPVLVGGVVLLVILILFFLLR